MRSTPNEHGCSRRAGIAGRIRRGKTLELPVLIREDSMHAIARYPKRMWKHRAKAPPPAKEHTIQNTRKIFNAIQWPKWFTGIDFFSRRGPFTLFFLLWDHQNSQVRWYHVCYFIQAFYLSIFHYLKLFTSKFYLTCHISFLIVQTQFFQTI